LFCKTRLVSELAKHAELWFGVTGLVTNRFEIQTDVRLRFLVFTCTIASITGAVHAFAEPQAEVTIEPSCGRPLSFMVIVCCPTQVGFH
jgi:hypothetical protein